MADDDSPGWLDRGLFPFKSRFRDIAGNRVHYIDEGDGPVLLMLHGNPTWSFLYRHLVRLLAPDFRCIAVDYPGFGLSQAAPDYGFTPREHSAVVEGLVDALGLDQLTIMVQDWGGPIGLGLAGRRPELTRALLIGNSFAWPATGGMIAFSRLFGSRLGRWSITRQNLMARWLIPAGTNRTLSRPELAAYYGPFPSPASRLPIWTFARQIRLSRAYLAEVEAGLRRIADRPALIAWGEADGAFRAADRERFERLFPAHRTVVLAGAKHFIQENAPDTIAAAIRDWFPVAAPSH
ncbi:alpha/beta fold hydrolase [Sphingomonas ginkgonis]|uniref:Alpha/beta fold hydrolase n=1 Tax=Sphingomonas ginkgonis TaxID=2315330 RepID=A0A3R9WRK6_9SPHN|nr:alpha/beta fold hydrolase [Sphingomonas ginkgonis]RST31691.1 alpha/beta fold hydrolase [Sphingomonas ginkgonis]